MRVIVLTRPLSPERPSSSTAEIVNVGLERGHELFITHPADLSMGPGDAVAAVVRRVGQAVPTLASYGGCASPETLDVSSVDLLLMRLQPPVESSYLAACHMLQHAETRVPIMNRPSALALTAEKMFAQRFPDVHPPTVISGNYGVLTDFRRDHGDVVVKPLYDFQGGGVFLLRVGDKNFDALLETLGRHYGTPLVMQRYLPDVRKGDKRIFLLDGKPVAALNRVPAADSARANLHAGGRPEATELTRQDEDICERLGPQLTHEGFDFAGLDVIEGYVTEISVASPTGLVPLHELGGTNVAVIVWEWLERRDMERT